MFSSPQADQDMPDFHEPSLALRDKAKNVVVTCAIGGQAMLAGKLLIDYGFKVGHDRRCAGIPLTRN